MIKSDKNTTISFFENAKKEIQISEERVSLLKTIATKTAKELTKNNTVNLNFICTHNSRRSQMGQVWSFFAADYFNIENIYSFSGGTEITAFHGNTVKTLQKTGFNFDIIEFSHENPRYSISFEGSKKTALGFSKKFDSKENKQPFIAITTCNNADENCPFIPEAIDRFHLPFVDPKVSDNTPEREGKYLETNQQIAGEIFIIFEEISKQITQ